MESDEVQTLTFRLGLTILFILMLVAVVRLSHWVLIGYMLGILTAVWIAGHTAQREAKESRIDAALSTTDGGSP